MTASAGRGGRPRDPDVDERIRDATQELLIESGYASVTMAAVARRAGVAHTTVYRRWPSKAHLVHEVLFPSEDALVIEPGSSATTVLTELVINIIDNFSRPEARAALPGLLGEYQSDRALQGRLSARVEPAISDAITTFLADAAARGEVRAGIDGATVLDAIIGFALVGPFLHQDRSPAAGATELVALLLHGALAPPATATR